MSKILTLYRGDNIDNDRTKPAIYRSEGIISGAFDSGAPPNMIERLEFLNSVKIHIDHILDFEKDYYRITDYISFSDDEGVAKRFASYNNINSLVPCHDDYMETRYLFKLTINADELIEIAPGIWEYFYICNTELKVPYKLNEDDEFENYAHTWALRFNSCPICQGKYKAHRLKLINPSETFPNNDGSKVFKRAINLAKKNKEWLVLPNDIIDRVFRATRIPLADFYSVQGYTIEGEDIRNPLVLPYKGY